MAECECHEHAESCSYIATYGRGICHTCLHNTRGYHCELCSLTYYPNMSLPVSDVNRCIECDCDLQGVFNNSLVCAQENSSTETIGQCLCRPLISGRRCDQCVPGYYELKDGPTPGNCTACNCNSDGTVGQSNTCQQTGGQCPCKNSIVGRECDTCADSYFLFPTGNPQRDCLTCDCDKGGSIDKVCDKTSGQCSCRQNITGEKCNQVIAGTFVPMTDTLIFEPQPGACEIFSDLYTTEHPFDGASFVVCNLDSQNLTVSLKPARGATPRIDLQWPYIAAVRYSSNNPRLTGRLSVQVKGDTPGDGFLFPRTVGQNISSACPLSTGSSHHVMLAFPSGQSAASLSLLENITLDARCEYILTLDLYLANITSPVRKKRAVLLESENQTAFQESYLSCLQQVASLVSRQKSIEQSPCQDLLFSLGAELYDGASACNCSIDGTDPEQMMSCQSLGGQCQCLPGVSGRTCDTCTPGYFNLTSSGCTACNCHTQGAKNGACNVRSGQCVCHPNITILSDVFPYTDNMTGSRDMLIDGTCSTCQPGFYGVNSGTGCGQCQCNLQGSSGQQCDETGQCPCKDSVTGLKCDVCRDGFFGFSAAGCSVCNCSISGATDSSCNQTTGECTCRRNVEGPKCTECRSGFFNLASYNPGGCQPCFCYGHANSCTSSGGFMAKVLQVTNQTSLVQIKALLGDHHISYGLSVTLGLTIGYLLDLFNETILTFSGVETVACLKMSIISAYRVYCGCTGLFFSGFLTCRSSSCSLSMSHRATNGTVIVPGQTLHYVVQLLEQNWVVHEKPQETTAIDVMEILANVTEVSLISKSQGQDVTVTYLGLQSGEKITEDRSDVSVTYVEECTCNTSDHVQGLSCERCTAGHMRANLSNLSNYDLCVPCQCQGRGVTEPPECLEETGLCLNCRNGTTGDHCEKCAEFVFGDDCSNCSATYWGLQADGCRACNCSSPGSLRLECDQYTGQCPCANHVDGRTCGQCQENFQALSLAGCTECDVCYTVMKTQIVPLRDLRSSISYNVTRLQSEDVTTTLGSFTSRLKSADKDAELLVDFLTSMQQSASEISTKMAEFNGTLEVLLEQTADTENMSLTIEQTFTMSDTVVKQAMSHRAAMEARTTTVFTDIASLQVSSLVLGELIEGLKLVESHLQSLVDASTVDKEVIGYLTSLNQTVSNTDQLLREVSQKSQNASTVHQDSARELITLESMFVNLLSQMSRTQSKSHSLSSLNLQNRATVKRLQDILAGLLTYVIDYLQVATRTTSALSLTRSFQSQVTAESNFFSPSNMRALQSVSVLEPFFNGTQNLSAAASHLLWLSADAQQRTSIIQTEANLLLVSTQSMLTTVTNFSLHADDVQLQANTSLNQLVDVSKQSQALIEQSDHLTESLVLLQQNVSAARETTQQVVDMLQNKQQTLLNLSNQAEKLAARVESVVDVSKGYLQALNNTDNNIVIPAQQQCLQVSDSVSGLRDQLSTAESAANEAVLKVSNVTQEASQVLAVLNNMPSVDTPGVLELLDRVHTARASVDVESLRTTIRQLQASRDIQRADIVRLSALRDSLRERVHNLLLLQEQIVRL